MGWEDAPVVSSAPVSGGWKDAPIVVQETAKQEQPKGFWNTLTAPGFIKETTPVTVGERFHDVNAVQGQVRKEWDVERARRIKAGESTNGMEKWKLQRENELIKESKGQHGPDPGFKEIFNAVKDKIKTDPGGFAASMIRGMAATPEVMFLPNALPARMAELTAQAAKAGEVSVGIGRVAAAAARTATEVVQTGAVVGGESVLKQLADKGEVNPKQVMADTLMVATPIVVSKAIVAGLKTKGVKAELGPVSKEVATAIEKDGNISNEKISVLMKSKGFDDQQIAHVVEATKPLERALKEATEAVEPPKEEPHAVEKGQEAQGNQPEHQRVEPQRVSTQASDSHSSEQSGQITKEEAKVVSQEKVFPKKLTVPDKITPEIRAVADNMIINGEKPMAVVRFGGKEFDNPNHPMGIKQAMDEGLVPTDPKTRSIKKGADDSINLFRLKDGTLITREQAGELFGGAKRTEDMKIKPKAKGEVPPQLAMPEGVPHGEIASDKARTILEDAGMEAEDATKVIGSKPAISTAAIRRSLTKFMGGQKYADGVLLEAVRNGKFGNLESGKIDQTLLNALGLTALGAAGYALYKKDPAEAMTGALATGGLIAATLLLKRGLQGIAEVSGVAKDTRYRIDNVTDKYFGDLEAGRLANYRFANQIKTLVSDPKMREAMTHYLQGDASIVLDPKAKIAADAVKRYFEQMGSKGQKSGILPEELIDNYVTQLWTNLNKNDGVWNNLKQALGVRNSNSPGMSPTSRFGMERVIPFYKEGMAKGMIPSTLDVAEILRIYGDNINKAVANKKLIETLQTEKTPWGESLVAPDTPYVLARQLAKTAAMIDKQWQGGGDIAKDIREFATRKAPKEYVTIDHPQMRGLKVHQDIAPVMKWLFDANNPNAATKLLYGVSIAAKRGLFSYSLFHVKSLADAMLGTSMKGWGKVLNGDAWLQLRTGKGGDILDELVRGGLKVGEKPLEGDVTPFSNALKLFEEKYPVIGVPAKAARLVGKAMDSFLWSTVHPTFKSAAAMAAFEKILKDRPELSRVEAAKAAASFTNDIFGGLDWFKIADGVQNKVGRDWRLQ